VVALRIELEQAAEKQAIHITVGWIV